MIKRKRIKFLPILILVAMMDGGHSRGTSPVNGYSGCSDALDAILNPRNESEELKKVHKLIEKLEDRIRERRSGVKRVKKLEELLKKVNGKIEDMANTFNNRIESSSILWNDELKKLSSKMRNELGGKGNEENERVKRRSRDSSRSSLTTIGTDDTARRVARVERKIGDMESKIDRIFEEVIGFKAMMMPQVQKPVISNIYGVSEIANIYDITTRDVQQAINSLKLLKSLPAIYSVQVSPGGLKTSEEIDLPITVLQTFHTKLRKSLADYEDRVGQQTDANCFACGSTDSSTIDFSVD